ncbi:MAG: TetR/AcrR family transcriptional regulator [Kineosporiaceae bacterium]|nr:TetR/AcrR family transcriptional regulator [Kineosporiaceae bacterium]
MSPSTVERLRAAAEDLLLAQGQAATTLRDITERADANVAAVSYHFGSKDALLALVYGEALREVVEVQRRRLDDVPSGVPLADLVRVWLAPALGTGERDDREARLWALIQRGMAERAPGLLANLESIRDVVDTHLIERLAAAVPHLDRDELMLRHDAVLAAVGALAGGATGSPLGGEMSEEVRGMLLTWIVGGLQAPATAGRSSGAGPRQPGQASIP